MHHLRQSSSSVHSPFAPTKKVTEEAETDTEEEEEEEEEVDEEEEEEEEEGNGDFGAEIGEEPELKKKRMNFVEGPRKRGSITAAAVAEGAGGGGGVAVAPPQGCRAENCKADLTDSKSYHKRHKVCEYHAKAEVVVVEGLKQRFCQQCSRFHDLSEFDEAKRSCRRRLAGHNERRRKHFTESRAEGSGRRGSNPGTKKDQCRQVDERGRTPIVLPENHQKLHIH